MLGKRIFTKSAVKAFVAKQARTYASQSTGQAPKRTVFYDLHKNVLGGTMVEFAGWEMPVVYKGQSIIQSHLHVRQAAGLFDVSHMGQLRITGADSCEFLESLVPGDLKALKLDQARLTQLTNEKGGIMDDTIITKKADDKFYMIINAGCVDSDMKHLNEQLELAKKNGKKVDIEFRSNELSLLALQGPQAAAVLSRFLPKGYDLDKVNFMTAHYMDLAGIGKCHVTRCGYTGEDGFEISVPNEKALDLANALLNEKEVQPAGLGARDSLRLEAGLCLMGHDMTPDITPIEAGLNFTISKRRRAEGGFPGAKVIQEQLANGVAKKRIGFIVGGAPAREGAEIFNEDGTKKIGVVTSGLHSPFLKKNIGMGYVETAFSPEDTKIQIEVRGKKSPGVITKMPFVEQRYHRVK